jgi:hypothetical protein
MIDLKTPNKQTDLIFKGKTNFIVIGFFTPDYHPLAKAFSDNLQGFSISHHLYAREKSQGAWGHQTLQKPSVLIQARRDYPDLSIVLMDVDCRVRGDISSIDQCAGDIAMPFGRKPMKNGTALKPGTRVLLVKPTVGADRALQMWGEKCRLNITPVENDEIRLQMAIEEGSGQFCLSTLPRVFQGYEIRKARPDDLIVHDSARDEARFMGGVRKDLKFAFRRARNSLSVLLTGKDYK